MQKWLKVMGANFLETLHWNLLKLLKHVTIIHMRPTLKQIGKWIHGFDVIAKKKLCSMYFCIL